MEITRAGAPQPPTKTTLTASLSSLLRTISAPRSNLDPAALRSRLLALGDAAAVKAGIADILASAPRATVRDFANQLGRLSLHFWRPDFTPAQAHALYGDFVSDMAGVTPEELASACHEYRTDPLNSFFPTPGKLLELVKDGLAERKRLARGAALALEALDNACEENGADSKSTVDIGARLKDLALKLGTHRPSALHREESKPVTPAHAQTARAETDADELRAALARRQGAA